MNITYTKRKPDAFYCAGQICDWYAGTPLNHDFAGTCEVHGAIFKTWLDSAGERNWQYVTSAK